MLLVALVPVVVHLSGVEYALHPRWWALLGMVSLCAGLYMEHGIPAIAATLLAGVMLVTSSTHQLAACDLTTLGDMLSHPRSMAYMGCRSPLMHLASCCGRLVGLALPLVMELSLTV